MNILKRIKKYLHYKRVHHQFRKTAGGKLSDHQIGISFAIATFLAVLPISSLAIVICIGLSFLFRYLKKIPMLLAILFWNPIWPIFVFSYPANLIGKFLLASHMDTVFHVVSRIPYAEKIVAIGIYYAVGMCVIALYVSILSYFVVRLLVKLYRLRQERKLKNESNSRSQSKARSKKY